MSELDPPELAAFRDLQALVRHLGDELGAFRRRALTAEARLRELDGAVDGEPSAPSVSGADREELTARITALEEENARLQQRLETATGKAKQMYDRVRFLRQQAQGGER